ncbi:hypothetical protein [Azospirillum thiophilum]|uniref:hypothetical protein n=1 Tax=Azospirillum thiophilum TaxID=528244 RepID=UPI000698F475|nr:hypothetical protein [Azospirillum thiophilum]
MPLQPFGNFLLVKAKFDVVLNQQAEERTVETLVLDVLRAMTEDAIVSGSLADPHQHLETTITVHDYPSKERGAVLR